MSPAGKIGLLVSGERYFFWSILCIIILKQFKCTYLVSLGCSVQSRVEEAFAHVQLCALYQPRKPAIHRLNLDPDHSAPCRAAPTQVSRDDPGILPNTVASTRPRTSPVSILLHPPGLPGALHPRQLPRPPQRKTVHRTVKPPYLQSQTRSSAFI